jgi:hypothetical protein
MWKTVKVYDISIWFNKLNSQLSVKA